MAATRAASGQPERPERARLVADQPQQLTLNQRVQGSNPCTPTNDIRHLGRQPNGQGGRIFDLGADLGVIGNCADACVLRSSAGVWQARAPRRGQG